VPSGRFVLQVIGAFDNILPDLFDALDHFMHDHRQAGSIGGQDGNGDGRGIGQRLGWPLVSLLVGDPQGGASGDGSERQRREDDPEEGPEERAQELEQERHDRFSSLARGAQTICMDSHPPTAAATDAPRGFPAERL
jgi:hypothetical protein